VKLLDRPGRNALQRDRSELSTPILLRPELLHRAVEEDLHLLVHVHLVLQQLVSAEPVASLDHRDLVHELGEEQALLQPAVPAAQHDQLLGALVERPITRGAEVDSRPDQLVLPGRVRPAVRGAAGDEGGSGVVVVAGGRLHVHLVAVARDREDRHGLQQLDSVPPCLLDDPFGQLGPADPLREAGVVVEAFGHAGLSAKALAVDHERLEILASCVDRGR
jgi:hypothetical protein